MFPGAAKRAAYGQSASKAVPSPCEVGKHLLQALRSEPLGRHLASHGIPRRATAKDSGHRRARSDEVGRCDPHRRAFQGKRPDRQPSVPTSVRLKTACARSEFTKDAASRREGRVRLLPRTTGHGTQRHGNGRARHCVKRECGSHAARQISEQTYYRWRREYRGLRSTRRSGSRREDERLKKAVSELTLDKLILKEALSGNSKPFAQAGVR